MKKSNIWITGLIGSAAALSLLRRYGTHSGATWTEYRQTMPGDEVIPRPDLEITNAISVWAPAERIWPWLVQLGYYRGGWFTDSSWRDWDYYPDRIMRFFVREEVEKSGHGHRDAPTASQIVSEFQDLKVGDVVLDGPPRIGIGGEFTWGFFIQETGETHTRLLLRTRGTIQPWWYRVFINTTIPIANIFLSRKMLSGIKQSSEQSTRRETNPSS
ncbi:MAG TPA: hypothetical protein VFZ43_09925 [Anaerolineales bacterium]